jgi:hypothetical protein
MSRTTEYKELSPNERLVLAALERDLSRDTQAAPQPARGLEGSSRSASLRSAALAWAVGLTLVVAGAASPLITLVGLGLVTAGTAVVGISAHQAERCWSRDRVRWPH